MKETDRRSLFISLKRKDELYTNNVPDDIEALPPLTNPIGVAKKHEGTEAGDPHTAEQIARERELENNGALDTGLTNTIIEQEKFKLTAARRLIICTSIYFCGVTAFIFWVVYRPEYSDTLKSLLLGGFFTNLVGLLIIIFKYVFSPSKEVFDLLMRLKEHLRKDRE